MVARQIGFSALPRLSNPLESFGFLAAVLQAVDEFVDDARFAHGSVQLTG